MKLTNQKPVTLSPVYQSKISGDFDPPAYMKSIMVTPLFNPMVPGQNVQITNKAGIVSDDDILTNLIACCQTVMDTTMETWCKTLYSKALVHFDPNTHLAMQEFFPIQAAVQEKLPFPASNVVYSPATDVIPVSKEFLAGQCTYEKYLATMAFYARVTTLGFYFANEIAFDGFKTWLAQSTAPMAGTLPAETNQMLTDFQALKLDGLTESLIIRNTDSENNEEFSFARLLVSMLMQYTAQISPALFGPMPFNLGELFCPKTLVFINVERHSHATAKQVADEWKIIENSLNMKLKMISNNKLQKLTASARNLQKISSNAANALTNMQNPTSRSANIRFKHTAPTVIDMARIVRKIMAKMTQVNMSDNSYKSVKMTFAKPNRRNPDDFNKQGKSVSTKYKPDIHIYIDTSGSISAANYEDAIKACIKMAKKLNVNLYFNSFSHVLSQCVKLNTRDKSSKQVYAEFERVPKVDGGTDYEQIWHYINKSKKRRREISILITDFEYTAATHFVKHPKNLYYIPCSRMDWAMLTRSANEFCQSMLHNDPAIRKHLLF